MMYPDWMIREGIEAEDPIAFVPEERLEAFGPIEDFQIQPASLDVRLGPDLVLHPSGRASLLESYGRYLNPGQCILASLVERLNMRSNMVAARIEGKSSWARRFLTVHSAGFIDPGFKGDVTLELKNDGEEPVFLSPGLVIAQISFHQIAAPVQRMYGDPGLNSHYQFQEGATGAR